MVKLKFWSIYSHIETSVIKIMRDIHANTLFVVKCSKKAPSQAKWWDLSDLHIQNLGEIDKIWVSVKMWMIQYNLSFCIRTENTYETFKELSSATIRMHSYFLYSAVAGTRVQNLTERKTKWAIRNMGKHRNLCHPLPPGHVDRDIIIMALCDMLWPVTSGAWHPVVTRPIVPGDQAPMGWPVPGLTMAPLCSRV